MSGSVPPPPPPPPPRGTPPPPPAYGQAPVPGMAPNGKEYAQWIWRVLAYIIDMIAPWIVIGIGWVIAGALTTSQAVERTSNFSGQTFTYTTVESTPSAFGFLIAVACYIIAIAFYLWNKGYREGTTGKSIGKQITGYTTVKEETGEPLGAGMGIARAILLYFDFFICYVGVLWPLWDPKRQCLISDKATGAVVYKD